MLAQLRAGDDAGDARADDHDLDVLVDGVARRVTGVNGSSRYLANASSCARSWIAAAALHHALLAFGLVLGPDRVRIEARPLGVHFHDLPLR